MRSKRCNSNHVNHLCQGWWCTTPSLESLASGASDNESVQSDAPVVHTSVPSLGPDNGQRLTLGAGPDRVRATLECAPPSQ